ncbi:hypothetical protein CTAYLR_007857 [Chrysophaeum taylorii]|uniref:NADP-dependent oxidoreductase domain-containing protein n=1 Tax=Chrysophaeum taylorii TaxID=2483200 RepID=A0AAD7UD63_9STRA|nr:hypothetical protein CTAYLR_007857 [Chrysophaeum taylorii]
MLLFLWFATALGTTTTIPQLGLGTYHMSGEVCYRAVMAALALGYRHVDTAEVYGNHEAVGRAVRDSGVPREEIFVTTKVSFADMEDPEAIERAVRALGLDYVDLALVHFPAPRAATGIPVWAALGISVEANVWRAFEARRAAWIALEAAQRRGLVKSLGVSNYLVPHLREMARYATVPPEVNQLEVHPFLPRDDVVAFCRDRGIVVEAYGSIAPGGTRDLLDHATVRRVAAAALRTPAQVLLGWAQQKGLVVLPKSTSAARIKENKDTFALAPLDARMLEELDALATTKHSASASTTGCGPWCPRGEYLWSPDVVPAIATPADWVGDASAPFREVPDYGRDWCDDDECAGGARRVAPRGVASTPLFEMPWEFDLEALRRDVAVVTADWDWNASEYGHARPLLSADELPPEFRDHFINKPHAPADLLRRDAPYLGKIYEWFSNRTEIVAFRLLRRLPLTAYGLHNDEDLHVRPDVRRMQIPVMVDDPTKALLLTTPFESRLGLAGLRGVDYADANPLLSDAAWPPDRKDHERESGSPPWYDLFGDGRDAEKKKLEEWVDDFAATIGSVYTLTTGRLHYFDTMKRHTLVGLGDEPRVTLVLDAVENDWMRAVMPAALVAKTKPSQKKIDELALARGVRDELGADGFATAAFAAPRNGSIVDAADAAASFVGAKVAFALSCRGSVAYKALFVLCGKALGKPEDQLAPDDDDDNDCALELVQLDVGGKNNRVGDAWLRITDNIAWPGTYDLRVDLDRCEAGARCVLGARLVGDGRELSPLSTVTLYVRRPARAMLAARLSDTLAGLKYADSHGARPGGFLGTGAVYYAMAYAQRASLAVVLGSGGGFVPSLVRQAQLDAGLGDTARTVLVDKGGSNDGSPDYFDEDGGGIQSPFRALYPEVEVWKKTTDEARDSFRREAAIDLLVVDADHSYAGSLRDALGWIELLAPTGVAILHDTGGLALGAAKTPSTLRRLGYDVVNLVADRALGDSECNDAWGCGLAIVTPPAATGGLAIIEKNMGTDAEVYAEIRGAALDDAPSIAAAICETAATRLPHAFKHRDPQCAADLLATAKEPSNTANLTLDYPDVAAGLPVDDAEARVEALLALRSAIDAELRRATLILLGS